MWEFRKNCTNEWPLRGKFMAKIRNFDSFGAVFPHFRPDKREIWHGGAAHSPMPNFTFIGATCRPCGAKNLFFDYWVKQYRHGCATRRPAGNNFCNISPICPEAPSGWISTKFCIGGPLADLINCAEFFVDRFRGIDFVGELKFAYPHRNWRSPLTLNYRSDCVVLVNWTSLFTISNSRKLKIQTNNLNKQHNVQ